MQIDISPTKADLGRRAAELAAAKLRYSLRDSFTTRMIVATGASQFEMLAALVDQPGIEWNKVTVFHLDEYAGMPESHPASFRKYLKERFLELLPVAPAAFHGIDGEADAKTECDRLGALISEAPIDVACIGIGENGHLAFNDPPADLATETPFIEVELDEACRRQQLGEGWFPNLDAVPTRAITMSIRQILKARSLVVSVPDARKAVAVRNALTGEISPLNPASALRGHRSVTLFLDHESSALLRITE